ncbi:MAG TPA: hypothetical protein VH275_06365 [Solirubrobacterales bacterium]|jgi:hypothetical protein|nr:hypothetical protein [Solirubrobacterales bacterium]
MNASLTAVLLATAALALLLLAPGAAQGFGFQPGSAGYEVTVNGEGEASFVNQAGAHPYSITTDVNLQMAPESPDQPGVQFSDGDLRDLDLELPPGLIENPSAVNKCSQTRFHTARVSPFEASESGESCPAVSQVGVVEIRSSANGGVPRSFGVFNLVPPPGFPSQIGFSPYGVPIVLTPHIRDLGGEYGLTEQLRGLSQRFDLYGMTLTLWGVPWAIAHNGQRGDCLNEQEPGFPFAKCAISPPQPDHVPFAYLTLPASCVPAFSFAAVASSWQGAGPVRADQVTPPLEGCAAIKFEPKSLAQVTNPRASSPTGFDFNLTANEEALTSPKKNVASQVRKAVVALPEGMTLNPSLAAGLGSCTPAQYAAESASSPPDAACPNQSKIGSFTVQSPLFEETIEGAIFLAEPDDPATGTPGAENPFDSLLALYLVAKAPGRGVLVKVAGKVSADPASGRLTASFDRLPQLPYSNLKMHFREGQRAPLVTAAACGSFSTEIDMTPWNAPQTSVHSSFPFQVAKGLGPNDACPGTGAPPFNPGAVGGTLNANAGSYTPFYLHLTRGDAEQEFTSYSATLPPGLLGSIANVPYCPEAAIAAAQRKTGGEEERNPSCPAASEIGHTTAGYGVGSVLAYAPGKLYLAGPYRGSTFSVVAVDSAKVGPFDLGVIIVRSAIRVDRRSAQVSIDSAVSDPIPHILGGIPIHLRDIRVYIDRPHVTVNPTSCDPSTLTSTVTGSGASFANPADDVAVAVPSRFQVFNCSALGFKPGLRLKLRGGTKRGDYPSLRAIYRSRPGDANIASAAVTLPPSLFLAQDHIQTICTRPQSERDACPAGAIYGQATAVTPLLAEPLEGPVYLRSSDNPLPDLVVALRGNGIAIDLVGRIDSRNGGLRARFEGLPDAPVSAFELILKAGKRGLLVNAENICSSPQLASGRFIGHANRGEKLAPPVRANCRKPKGKRGKGGHGKGKRGRAGGRRR